MTTAIPPLLCVLGFGGNDVPALRRLLLRRNEASSITLGYVPEAEPELP